MRLFNNDFRPRRQFAEPWQVLREQAPLLGLLGRRIQARLPRQELVALLVERGSEHAGRLLEVLELRTGERPRGYYATGIVLRLDVEHAMQLPLPVGGFPRFSRADPNEIHALLATCDGVLTGTIRTPDTPLRRLGKTG
jgi:hypothetical protein